MCKKEVYEIIKQLSDSIFVTSAGNKSIDLDKESNCFPFNELDNVIIVASVDSEGKLSELSNYGKEYVDLAALGEDVEVIMPGGGSGVVFGTSYAASLVTRAIVCMKNANPKLSPKQIKEIICDRDNVDVMDDLKNKVRSGGILNIEKAVESAKSVEGELSAEIGEKEEINKCIYFR